MGAALSRLSAFRSESMPNSRCPTHGIRPSSSAVVCACARNNRFPLSPTHLLSLTPPAPHRIDYYLTLRRHPIPPSRGASQIRHVHFTHGVPRRADAATLRPEPRGNFPGNSQPRVTREITRKTGGARGIVQPSCFPRPLSHVFSLYISLLNLHHQS